MKKFYLSAYLTLGLFLFTTVNSYAYIDPGTGSLVIQAIAGALLIGGVAIKGYWKKITSFFNRK